MGGAPTTTPQECVAFVGFSSSFPVYGFRVIFDLPRVVSSVHPPPLCPGSPSYALRGGGMGGAGYIFPYLIIFLYDLLSRVWVPDVADVI